MHQVTVAERQSAAGCVVLPVAECILIIKIHPVEIGKTDIRDPVTGFVEAIFQIDPDPERAAPIAQIRLAGRDPRQPGNLQLRPGLFEIQLGANRIVVARGLF